MTEPAAGPFWVLVPEESLPAAWSARARRYAVVAVSPAELGGLDAGSREPDLLALVAAGVSRAQLARRLGISTRTLDRRLAALRFARAAELPLATSRQPGVGGDRSAGTERRCPGGPG